MSGKIESRKPSRWVVWALAGLATVAAVNGHVFTALCLAAATGYAWYRAACHGTEAYDVNAAASTHVPDDMDLPRKTDVMRTWLALF